MYVRLIAIDPASGELIEGAGGARKMRVARPGAGKSGGFRIITYYATADVPVFLLDIYGKGEKASLSKGEKNDLAKLLAMIAPAYRAGAKAAAAGEEFPMSDAGKRLIQAARAFSYRQES